ncbi:hypothetical protein LguiA_030965 [Lonicera macranthoides]
MNALPLFFALQSLDKYEGRLGPCLPSSETVGSALPSCKIKCGECSPCKLVEFSYLHPKVVRVKDQHRLRV